MLRIGKLSWKFIGCFVIFLILSVNLVSSANNQTNNNDLNDNRTNSMVSDSSRINNNVTDNNCSDDLTTYNYSGVYIDLPNVPTPLKIDDNWAGEYILIDAFLSDLGIHWNPPSVRTKKWYNFFAWLGDVIVYGLYVIWFALQIV
ncbi:MAG: hypothetical protein LBR15_02430, partial [Methanobrevibacter sp.]|nr:hypothetical protein [Candidatus Methanovirga australis]